ncbi:hypothetical protein [Streptomyces sp. NPDC001985]
MVIPEVEKPGKKRWTSPEKWQVVIALLGLILAIITAMGQFAR